MPIYDYKCEKCGEVFEVIQKFSDEPLAVHEKCGGAVERLISAPALQFKGSGWYITDYAKGGTSSPAKSESKSAESTPAKTESKPAGTESKKSD
jgi:putative FmdB family regulatory protein